MPESGFLVSGLFSHPFAQFALKLYGRPKPQALCLFLQDKHGVDINILLWAAWIDNIEKPAPSINWQHLDKQVRVWRHLSKTLRYWRRKLKGLACCYRLAKQSELWAEGKEMQVLYRISKKMPAAALAESQELPLVQQYLQWCGCGSQWSEWLSCTSH